MRQGFAAELVQIAQGFEEDIVRGVLGLLRVAQEAEGQVINGAAVLAVNRAKLGIPQPVLRLARRWAGVGAMATRDRCRARRGRGHGAVRLGPRAHILPAACS